MCLAIPGKIVAIDGDTATVEYGEEMREANCSLVKCKIGDYVIIQAHFVMEIVPKERAEQAIDTIVGDA